MGAKTVRRLLAICISVLVGVGFGTAKTGQAQPIDISLTSQQPPTRITIQPVFQRYEDGQTTLSEGSVPLEIFVPIQDNMLLGLRTGLARAGGTDFTSVTGRGDLQANLSYSRAAGAGSIVFNLGVNLPSGTTSLTDDEFETVTRLSYNFYEFQMPGFGQGLNLTPGVTWAVPAGERVLLGLGASYKLRGGFTPIDGMEASYDPGNEVRLTGGADIQLGRSEALSGDITITLYGTDTLGEAEHYGPGHKISATAQYLHHIGFNMVRIVARYQSQAKSSLPATAGPDAPAEERRIIPTQGTIFVVYQHRVSDGINMAWRVDGQRFGKIADFSSKLLITVGGTPELSFKDQWILRPQFAYTLGSFSGLELGLGIGLEL